MLSTSVVAFSCKDAGSETAQKREPLGQGSEAESGDSPGRTGEGKAKKGRPVPDRDTLRFFFKPPEKAAEGVEYSYWARCLGIKGRTLELTKGEQDSCATGFKVGRSEDSGPDSDISARYTFRYEKNEAPPQCKLHLICSDGENRVEQKAVVTIDKRPLEISNLPAEAEESVGKNGRYDVEAREADRPVGMHSWSLYNKKCSFAPFIDAATGEVDWVCWAEGSCTVEVVLARLNVEQDRKPLTLRCIDRPDKKKKSVARCAEVVTVYESEKWGSRHAPPVQPLFTCPGNTVYGMAGSHSRAGISARVCRDIRDRYCGPRKVYDSGGDVGPRLKESTTWMQYRDHVGHGFFYRSDRSGEMRGWIQRGRLHGPFARAQRLRGIKVLQGSFSNNRRAGLWTSWYSGGQKESEGRFRNGRPFGRWTWWDRAGEVVDSRLFSGKERERSTSSYDIPSVDVDWLRSFAHPPKPRPRDNRYEPPAPMGTLRINTRPWSNIYVGGKLMGKTPQMGIRLTPGKHEVVCVSPPFGIRKTISVDIEAGKTVTKILTLVPGED